MLPMDPDGTMSELMEESMDSFIRHISQEHNSEYINPLPGNWRRDFLFVEKAVAESKKLWYNLDAVLPTPGNGRRCRDGSYHYLFSRCCGWCSLPLHHQMVRRRP